MDQPAVATMDFSLSVQYSPFEIAASGVTETTLALYCWDESSHLWVKDANSVVDPLNNRITTHTRRTGDWAVFGSEGGIIFLPLLTR